jgi:polyhydroxyalkanoate synthesis regulator phasin
MADSEERNDIGSLVEKVYLMGFGAAEMTRDKIVELAGDLEKRGRNSDSDVKEVTDKVSAKAAEQGKALGDAISKEVERASKTAGMATRADVDALKAELTEIKQMLARMQPADAGDTDA